MIIQKLTPANNYCPPDENPMVVDAIMKIVCFLLDRYCRTRTSVVHLPRCVEWALRSWHIDHYHEMQTPDTGRCAHCFPETATK